MEENDEEIVDLEGRRDQFPTLLEVMDLLCFEERMNDFMGCPRSWDEKLPGIESSLKLMTQDEKRTFCVGTDVEMKELIEKYSAQDAHDFLNGFFDAWSMG